ncbi:cytidine deaminase [Clostridium sp. BJN0001]|uniref:cytidine deaminase n=1 Tax=Clostridium sp. BJN0001 TaxID=2930219 RepID=UPI001FD42E9A|nr:cytidine deaminase [Clostridium sp. BJN0001]
MDYKELIKTALFYRNNSYSPYSHFKVGAALITKSSKIFGGCNIENASYGATNCAERTALFKAVSEGEKEIEALAIVGSRTDYTFPCGICRQVLAEFFKSDTKIIIAKNEDDYIVKNFRDILPDSFDKKDIDKG